MLTKLTNQEQVDGLFDLLHKLSEFGNEVASTRFPDLEYYHRIEEHIQQIYSIIMDQFSKIQP